MREIDENDDKLEKIKPKRRRSISLNSCHLDRDSIALSRRYNRAVRSLRKPSYLLGLGPRAKSLRCEYRDSLVDILHELLLQRNWREACGVLSVLMKGTGKNGSPELNRLKHTAFIQIMNHLRANGLNSSEICQIYDTWIGKIASEHKAERLEVCLEQILHFLKDGNNEDAYQAATSLMQHREFGKSPRSYLVIGMTFYQLWYCKFLEELKSEDADHISSELETSESKFNKQIGLSSGHKAAYSLETEASARCDSETSVMNDKRISHMSISNSETETSMKVAADLKMYSTSQPVRPLQIYASSDEDQVPLQNDAALAFDPSLISLLGSMDSWLIPMKLPQDHDYYIQMLNDSSYKEAVKYLRLALHSSLPVSLAALHPLVQLSLIGGQVDEAMREVEEVCSNIGDLQAFRIRAVILETFHPDKHMLAKNYEDVLKIDGTCSRTLKKLVNMHYEGEYSVESLIEMIGLHLETSYPEPNIWRELASCFLKLFQCDEEQMSVCLDGAGVGQKQRYSIRYNQTPKLLTDGRTGKSWKIRCRWWLTRHFSQKLLDSEIKNGELQLMTYKAACASHMYGHVFGYVLKVYQLLKKSGNRDLVTFLQTHRQNSIGLCKPTLSS